MTIPLHGQVAVSGSAQQLSSAAIDCAAFSIKAPYTNTHPVLIGSSIVSLTTGDFVDPGERITYERFDQNGQPRYNLRPSDFWVVGTSGDSVSWLASP